MDYEKKVADVREVAEKFLGCWRGENNEKYVDLWSKSYRAWNSEFGMWISVEGDQCWKITRMEKEAFAKDFPDIVDNCYLRAVWEDGFIAIRDLTYTDRAGKKVNINHPHLLTVRDGQIVSEEEWMAPPARESEIESGLAVPDLLTGPAYQELIRFIMKYAHPIEGKNGESLKYRDMLS